MSGLRRSEFDNVLGTALALAEQSHSAEDVTDGQIRELTQAVTKRCAAGGRFSIGASKRSSA